MLGRALKLRNFKIPADLPGEEFVDLSMPRDSRDLPGGAIDVDGMGAALPQELAAVLFEPAY